MVLKPATTIPDQIVLLQQRGMTINDIPQASEFLQLNHYYRLNIYFHKLMDARNHFSKNTTFSRLITIYENDRWLRNRILPFLEWIEIKARSIIANHLGLNHGSDVFYKVGVYKNASQYQQLQTKISSQMSRNSKDAVVRHHQKYYQNQFPIWVIVEFLSFNMLSRFFSNLQTSDKKSIAKKFNNSNDRLFENWLHVLSVQRNICAHYGYLFRREYPIRPIIAKSFKWDPTQDNQLFALFLVMRRLSDRNLWLTFIQNISDAEKIRPFFDLRNYGFPTDWRSYLV